MLLLLGKKEAWTVTIKEKWFLIGGYVVGWFPQQFGDCFELSHVSGNKT